MEKKEDMAACLRALLTGLEIENIEKFMSRLSVENCIKLGAAYVTSVLEVLSMNEKLIEQNKELVLQLSTRGEE